MVDVDVRIISIFEKVFWGSSVEECVVIDGKREGKSVFKRLDILNLFIF